MDGGSATASEDQRHHSGPFHANPRPLVSISPFTTFLLPPWTSKSLGCCEVMTTTRHHSPSRVVWWEMSFSKSLTPSRGYTVGSKRHERLLLAGPDLSAPTVGFAAGIKPKERSVEMAVRTPHSLTGKRHSSVFSCSLSHLLLWDGKPSLPSCSSKCRIAEGKDATAACESTRCSLPQGSLAAKKGSAS